MAHTNWEIYKIVRIGLGRSRMITQFYFAMGVWGRQGMNHLREKNESHNVSLLVMIGYVIRPEEETRLSDVFTLNSLRERSSMLGSLLR